MSSGKPIKRSKGEISGQEGELRGLRPCSSAPPPFPPDTLADQTGNARCLLGDRDDGALRRPRRDLEQELGADRLLEFLAILDRDHEGAWASDDAIFVVPIEILDIHRR